MSAHKPSDARSQAPQVRGHLPPEIDPRLKGKMVSMLADFRRDLAAHPYCRTPSEDGDRYGRRKWYHWGVRRPVLATAATGIVCLALLAAILLYDRPPTWAEVERQFGTIRYCTITMYLRHNPFDRPVFAQYWFGPDGRARAHVDEKVVFIAKDAPLTAYHLNTRRRSKPGFPFKEILRALDKAGTDGAPTLGTLIAAMAGEGMVDTTDLVFSDPQVSQDLVVYDAVSRENLWWLRIWALRESRLPTRILKWHRRTGRFVDLQFTYAKTQQPDFFDPEAFAALIADPEIDDRRLRQELMREQTLNLFPSHLAEKKIPREENQ